MRWLSTLDLPVVVDFSLDFRVLGFALALSLVTGILFGLAPALHSTRVDLWQTLRDDGEVRASGRRRFSLKNSLVVFQVAVSVFLLAGTGLALQMVAAGRAQRVGYAVDGVAMLQTDARYVVNTPADQPRLFEQLLTRVRAIPGVQAAVLTRDLPMDVNGLRIAIDGAADGSTQNAAPPASGPAPVSSRRSRSRFCMAARSTSAIARAGLEPPSSTRGWRAATSGRPTPSDGASASSRAMVSG